MGASPERGHAPDTTNVRALALFGLGFFALLALCAAGVRWLQHAYVGATPVIESRDIGADGEAYRSAPRWGRPGAKLRARAAVAEEDGGADYAWVDREARLITVPLELAERLLLASGYVPGGASPFAAGEGGVLAPEGAGPDTPDGTGAPGESEEPR